MNCMLRWVGGCAVWVDTLVSATYSAMPLWLNVMAVMVADICGVVSALVPWSADADPAPVYLECLYDSSSVGVERFQDAAFLATVGGVAGHYD